MLADGNRIPTSQQCLSYAVAVNKGAIETADVLNVIVALLKEDSGVVVRNGGIVDKNRRLGGTTNCDRLRKERIFLEDRIFKAERKLRHSSPPKLARLHAVVRNIEELDSVGVYRRNPPPTFSGDSNRVGRPLW